MTRRPPPPDREAAPLASPAPRRAAPPSRPTRRAALLLGAASLGACAPDAPPRRPAAPAAAPAPPPAPPADPLGPKPEAAEPAPFTPPAPAAFAGPAGSKVWLLERHGVPLVSVALVVPYGSSFDPPDAGGLAHLAADMLDEGAGARDAVAFSSALEELGARVVARADRDFSVVALETTAANFDAALALFADAVLRPRHAPKDFARVTALWKNALRARGDDPAEVARVVGPAAFFGPAHPYGRPAEGSLGGPAIARERVAAWHRRLWRPEAATFVVAGDVTRERAAASLASAFGAWTAPREPAPARPAGAASAAAPAATAPAAGRRTVVVDRAEAPQVVISLVRPGVSAADPARPALELLNVPLGGTFTSRLNQNLREDHGWTYGARSGFAALRDAGTFVVRTSVRTDALGGALRETLKELDQMAQRGPTDAEVAGAKAQARADAIASYRTLTSIALGLAANAGLGLPPDADAIALAEQMRAGRARLAELGRAHVATDDATIVFVGPRRAVEEALAANKLPPPEAWNAEGKPLDASKGAAKAPAPKLRAGGPRDPGPGRRAGGPRRGRRSRPAPVVRPAAMKRTLGGALLAAALCFLGACTPPPFVSPARGGPAWTKLTTRHFTLYTDVPPGEARDTARELEEMYGALEDVAFPYNKKPTGRFEVTLFQREDAYREVAPPDARGHFQRYAHDPDGRPMVVLYHGVDPKLRLVLQHEFVHRFVAFYFPAAPRWLNEGLAQTYATLAFGGGEAQVGVVPKTRRFGKDAQVMLGTDRGVTTASRDEMPAVAELVASDWRHFNARDDSPPEVKRSLLYYEASWNLVHAMRFGAPPLRDAFEDYLMSLIKGREPRDAWRDALRARGVTAEQLEAAYREHVKQWGIPYERVVYQPRPMPAPHAQPMAEAEVHLLWARVRPWRGEEGRRRARDEVEAAIKADPNFAPAYVLRGEWFEGQRGGDEPAAADYRKALALAPDDFRPARALASLLDVRDERRPNDARVEAELAPLLERLRENAGSSSAWNFLAWYDARKGDPERGLPFARKAIATNPSCFECYDTAAVLLHRLGRLDEAVAAQRSAVHLMPDGMKFPAITDRLREFEGELAAAATNGRGGADAPASRGASEAADKPAAGRAAGGGAIGAGK